MASHTLLGRAIRNALAILLGIFMLELVLQIGAWVVSAMGREQPIFWVTGRRRILCLGDSFTYGLYLERNQAYPQQLEAIWNATPDVPEIEVLNLGFPGTNSSRLRRDFPRLLETFRPDLVIVLIGANDYWTVRVPLDPGQEVTRRSFLERHSRAYKLYYHLWRVFDTTQLDVSFDDTPEGDADWDPTLRKGTGTARFGESEFSLGFEQISADRLPDLDDAPRQLEVNLGELAAQVKAFDSDLWLLTYPSRFLVYGHANNVIRGAANTSEIRLVDIAEPFTPLCPEQSCPDLLFADQHPNAAGYRQMAEILVQRLRDR